MNLLLILYTINAILLILHEIESAYEKEWEILKLPGDISFFLIIHVPILIIIFLGTVWIERQTFQGYLVAGVPWGETSMGGKYPGKYPPKLRIVAILNMIVLTFISILVLSEAELYFSQLKSISRIGI